MNEETFNTALRKFLRTVGVTAQQEIEKSVAAAIADGRLKGAETLKAKMVLSIGEIALTHTIDADIALE